MVVRHFALGEHITIADWFNEMTRDQQEQYKSEHPSSDKAGGARTPAEKKAAEEKEQKSDKPKKDDVEKENTKEAKENTDSKEKPEAEKRAYDKLSTEEKDAVDKHKALIEEETNKEKEKDKAKKELKEEIKDEVKDEVKKEIKDELKKGEDKPKKDAKEEVKNDGSKDHPPSKNIKPADKKKVVALLDKLKKMSDLAKEKGEKAPNFDLCDVAIPGTNLFCGVNKGIPREKMPQLKGNARKGSDADKLQKSQSGEVDSEEAFKSYLKDKGIKMEPKKVDASRLKSTQSQLVGAKVAGMTAALKANPNNPGIRAPIYVSRDGYILDGHHRWAAVVGLELQSTKPVMMDTIVVDLSAEELVKKTNEFADEFGIEQKAA